MLISVYLLQFTHDWGCNSNLLLSTKHVSDEKDWSCHYRTNLLYHVMDLQSVFVFVSRMEVEGSLASFLRVKLKLVPLSSYSTYINRPMLLGVLNNYVSHCLLSNELVVERIMCLITLVIVWDAMVKVEGRYNDFCAIHAGTLCLGIFHWLRGGLFHFECFASTAWSTSQWCHSWKFGCDCCWEKGWLPQCFWDALGCTEPC